MSCLDDITARFDEAGLDERAVRWAKEFLRCLLVERGYSPNTVRAYAIDLRSYLDWARRQQLDPLEAGHRAFRRFVAEMDRAGYSKRTVSRRLSAVRCFFDFLNVREVVLGNPAAAVSTPKASGVLPRKTSVSDVERLLGVCATSDKPVDIRDTAFLELLYATGARISELAGLAVCDISTAKRQVRLLGKGSKERFVPVHDQALAAVDRYLSMARPLLLKDRLTGALFISTRANPMSADALRRVFKARAAQAGLDASLHPHDMRHSFATDLLEGGADLRSVQEMLGHASLSTTQIYTHLSLSHMRDTVKQAHPRS